MFHIRHPILSLDRVGQPTGLNPLQSKGTFKRNMLDFAIVSRYVLKHWNAISSLHRRECVCELRHFAGPNVDLVGTLKADMLKHPDIYRNTNLINSLPKT